MVIGPGIAGALEDGEQRTTGPALCFTVPIAPVPCARARVFWDARIATQRAVTPPTTRAYERVVRVHAMAAAGRPRWRPRRGASYVFSLRVFRARDVGDWDNYAKAVADALNGVAWVDDRQVVEAHVYLGVDREHPRVEIWVSELRVVEPREEKEAPMAAKKTTSKKGRTTTKRTASPAAKVAKGGKRKTTSKKPAKKK